MKQKKTLFSRPSLLNFLKKLLLSLLFVLLLFTLMLNTSSWFVKVTQKIPWLSRFSDVLLWRTYSYKEHNYWAEIQVPEIAVLEKEAVSNQVNRQLIETSRAKYLAFKQDMDLIKDKTKGHHSLKQSYQVLLEDQQLMVLALLTEEVQASSFRSREYITIDKKNGLVLSLAMLFKNPSYKSQIKKEINRQIAVINQEEERIFTGRDGFQTLSEEQAFYINRKRELVISFAEYEIAPGSMGIIEFVIPTEVIEEELLSHDYLK